MNKTIITIVIVAVVVLGGYFLFGDSYQLAPQSPTSESSVQQPSNQPPASEPSTQQPPASQAPVVAPTTHNVSIQSFAFSQKSINIKKGDTVVWTNKDSAPHTATGDNGGPASGTLNKGGIYSFTFNSAGTFNYLCKFHPSMTGSVVVAP